MRILHVMAGARVGGAENAFAELCIAQKKAGLDVYAACRPSARTAALQGAGIHLTELPFGGFFDFKTKRTLKKLINETKPALAVTWMNRAAKKFPSNTGVPHIARLGGYYNLKYYKHTDHFVVNAPDIGRWMQDQGTPTDKITFIPNFAEVDTTATPTPRASLNTPNDAFVFLALGRLHPNKAFDTLLDAFAHVADAHLWIAGEGPERKHLEARRRALGLDDRVHLLGWRDDRWALLAACNAVVFPSRHEPFGNTFMQAWAAGKPLVTTASQGPAHFVTDQKDALLTPIDDVPALAEAMQTLIKNPTLANVIAAEGKNAYIKAFDKQAILQQWKNLFAQLKA